MNKRKSRGSKEADSTGNSTSKEQRQEIKGNEKKKEFAPFIYKKGKIIVLSHNLTYQLFFKDIISIVIHETISNSVVFTCVNNLKFVALGSLVSYKKLLVSPDFIYTERGSIANMFHAEMFEDNKKDGILHLSEGNTVFVTKEHFPDILDFFNLGATI